MKRVIGQVSRAIGSASDTSNPDVIWGALYILTQLKVHSLDLAGAAYGWCATIWRNHGDYEDLQSLLVLSLEVGFRHIRSLGSWTFPVVTPIQTHREVVDTVLKSKDDEAVTDLAWASYMVDESGILGLNVCADYIVESRGRGTEPVPQELQYIFLIFVERRGLSALEDVGKERFVRLLNNLHIGVNDASSYGNSNTWPTILLEIIQSADNEAQNLTVQSWELLVGLAILGYLPDSTTYEPNVTTTLVGRGEWYKLECWMSIFWMVWPPEPGAVAKELEDAMVLLEKEQPGALRKRMERWSERRRKDLPMSFQQTCDKLAL